MIDFQTIYEKCIYINSNLIDVLEGIDSGNTRLYSNGMTFLLKDSLDIVKRLLIEEC